MSTRSNVTGMLSEELRQIIVNWASNSTAMSHCVGYWGCLFRGEYIFGVIGFVDLSFQILYYLRFFLKIW